MKLSEVPTETIDAIRSQYGYRTRAALMREFGLTEYIFDTICRKHGIERIDPAKLKVKAKDVDYSQMQAVRVPGLTGNAVVYSKKGKDPAKVISKWQK